MTHISHVSGVQLRAGGSSTADNVFSLLQMKATGVESFVQLSDVSLQRAAVTCMDTKHGLLIQKSFEL